MIERNPKRLFEFGQFSLDTRERSLSRDGKALALTPKSFEILLALVENRGRTLSKEELIDRVWPDSFVEIGNLNRNISTLRGLLGDDTHQPKFIKTLPKRGYRFDADVREVIEEEEELAIERRTRYSVSLQKTEPVASRRSITGVLVASVVLIGLVSTVLFMQRSFFSGVTAVGQDSTERYKEARRLWDDRSGESLHKATVLFEQLVAAEPEYALAHSGLADAYAFDFQHRSKAETIALRAIELDPNLSQPHATIGFLRAFWDWDLVEADEYFKRAIALDPNNATAHQWYAMSLGAMGQGNEMISELTTAFQLEPGSSSIGTDLCRAYYFRGRLHDAESTCLKVLAADPQFLSARFVLYDVYSALGKHDEAIEQFAQAEALTTRYSIVPNSVDDLRRAYASRGKTGYWEMQAEILARMPRTEYEVAKYHARLGDREAVFSALKAAYERRNLDFIYFQSEPLFVACCYGDDRYATFPPFLPTSRFR